MSVGESQRDFGRGGLRVSPYSFGMAPLGNLGRAVSDEDSWGALAAAWDAGARYFDVAPHYGLGLAERRLGEFLATEPRDEFIVSTKVGRLLVPNPQGAQPDTDGFEVISPLMRRHDYSASGIRRSIDDSLERLGLDRIDVIFVHDADEHYRQALDEALPALDDLRRQGVITSYGAGMNQSPMLAEFVLNTDADVMMCAGRYTLLEQGALDDLLPAALARDVSVVAAAVFNSGLLARDRPSPDLTYNYAPVPRQLLARVNAIATVCESHSVSLPAAAMQFTLGHPAVATVCTGARTATQVERNAALFAGHIPAALWSDLISAELIRADAPVPA